MSYTTKYVRALLPDVQFVGGAGVVRVDNKAVEVGRVTADGGFIPSDAGRILLESANTSASEAQVKPADKKAGKAKVEKAEQKAEPATVSAATEGGLGDLGDIDLG